MGKSLYMRTVLYAEKQVYLWMYGYGYHAPLKVVHRPLQSRGLRDWTVQSNLCRCYFRMDVMPTQQVWRIERERERKEQEEKGRENLTMKNRFFSPWVMQYETRRDIAGLIE